MGREIWCWLLITMNLVSGQKPSVRVSTVIPVTRPKVSSRFTLHTLVWVKGKPSKRKAQSPRGGEQRGSRHTRRLKRAQNGSSLRRTTGTSTTQLPENEAVSVPSSQQRPEPSSRFLRSRETERCPPLGTHSAHIRKPL